MVDVEGERVDVLAADPADTVRALKYHKWLDMLNVGASFPRSTDRVMHAARVGIGLRPRRRARSVAGDDAWIVAKPRPATLVVGPPLA